jgi:hypothetical protein
MIEQHNLYSPPLRGREMSLLGVKGRVRTHPPTSPSEPKMDIFNQPPGTLPDCCATTTAVDCCNAPLIPCTDEQCLELMDEYCQACLDHQPCQVPGCSFQCNECCDITTCTDGLCSATHTQVSSIGLCADDIRLARR